MITARFPNGVAVQYNAGHRIQRGEAFTDILGKDGNLIAQVPTHGCIVEYVKPCRVYNAITSAEIATDFLAALNDERQRDIMSTHTLADIKRVLDDFDARRRVWK